MLRWITSKVRSNPNKNFLERAHKSNSSTTAAYNDPHSAGMFESIGEDGAALDYEQGSKQPQQKLPRTCPQKPLQRSPSMRYKRRHSAGMFKR
ncbi:hypothetical protein J40TS1_15040 [Paenibacillus montaniterrae]|uniref:Uncharacterized protein n=1 Tax=Paenibacillus montaniterrae TaxID=429341 RepID=A0A920CTG4_9BACL|nr:hypothetical protein J40TS1_15040 [Paenibacillus montaniterrae]